MNNNICFKNTVLFDKDLKIKDNIYKFLWFIKKSYKNVNTNYIQNKWIKDIKQTHVKEFQNTKKNFVY